jgi:hypothetical protein
MARNEEQPAVGWLEQNTAVAHIIYEAVRGG